MCAELASRARAALPRRRRSGLSGRDAAHAVLNLGEGRCPVRGSWHGNSSTRQIFPLHQLSRHERNPHEDHFQSPWTRPSDACCRAGPSRPGPRPGHATHCHQSAAVATASPLTAACASRSIRNPFRRADPTPWCATSRPDPTWARPKRIGAESRFGAGQKRHRNYWYERIGTKESGSSPNPQATRRRCRGRLLPGVTDRLSWTSLPASR